MVFALKQGIFLALLYFQKMGSIARIILTTRQLPCWVLFNLSMNKKGWHGKIHLATVPTFFSSRNMSLYMMTRWTWIVLLNLTHQMQHGSATFKCEYLCVCLPDCWLLTCAQLLNDNSQLLCAIKGGSRTMGLLVIVTPFHYDRGYIHKLLAA